MIDKLDFLKSRGQQYKQTFGSEAGERVLADLLRFAKVGQAFHHPDPALRAMVEGRREVVARITDHLKLSPEQLLALYDKGSTQ